MHTCCLYETIKPYGEGEGWEEHQAPFVLCCQPQGMDRSNFHRCAYKFHLHTLIQLLLVGTACRVHGVCVVWRMVRDVQKGMTLNSALCTTVWQETFDHKYERHTQISWRKLSRVALKVRNSWMFPPSKIFCYMVIAWCTHQNSEWQHSRTQYSGTSPLQTSSGPHKVSWLKRCPYFGGSFMHFSM